MTAPFDARYLVRLDTLPPVSGAPTAYLCTECGAALAEPVCLDCKHYRLYSGAPVECLDLSAPPERDGIPERLDALPWALAVLAKRVGMAIDDIDAIRPMMWQDSIVWDVYNFGGRYLTILSPEDDGWEDFDVDDPNQPRRIVAAALRKTHVQKVSP